MGSWSGNGWRVHDAGRRPRRLGKGEASLTKTNILISEDLDAQLEARRVVFEFCSEPRTIRIRPRKAGEGGYKMSYRSISAKSLYLHFSIHERGRFPAFYEDGAILIPLQQS